MDPFDMLLTRRDFLAQNALGVGSVALATLLHSDGLLAAPHVPKARH